jgi:urease beta subunit
VVGVLGKFLEVRAVFGSQKMVQTIPLRGLRLITHKTEIYVATSQAVWRLVPVPLLQQISSLENDRKYKQALTLAENIPFSSEEEKREKIRQIKVARAYNQFAKRRFTRALELFYELGFDPLRVIGLYPDLLPRAIRSTFTYPITMPELEGPVLETALQELINYLAQKRINCTPDPKLRNEDYALTKDLAEIIDTALLKAYLKTKDALVAPLLRLPNHCHVRECETVLQLNKVKKKAQSATKDTRHTPIHIHTHTHFFSLSPPSLLLSFFFLS